MAFVHLHTHTEFSMLDATLRVEDLVERAVQDGATSIALTDHDNMYGAVQFYEAAQARGIHPILGSELALVPSDEPEARADESHRRDHTLVLLCRNETGYQNLCYLLSRAYMDAPVRTRGPRIDRALLAEYADGLVALSGGLSGDVPQRLLRGDREGAAALARHYSGLFQGWFYLELIRNGIEEQERVNEELMRLSEELGIPLVATADAHYGQREDAGAHEVLMCIQMGKQLPDLDTRARITDELHLAPAEEMAERFADVPEAVANTERIAEACTLELTLGEIYLPSYGVPEGHDAASYLRHLADRGLRQRFETIRERDGTVEERTYWDRLEKELGIIEGMGYPGYYLIVWDFIEYARSQGIPVGPGRGSGAGSLVAYALRITDVDPIRYGLLFERFLNPERVSMPDFDIDFCMHRRDEVIDYVTDKYGENSVAHIVTYGTMKAKAVVRDVARVLGLTFAEADRAAKLIPDDPSITLPQAWEQEPGLKQLCDEDARYARLFEVAPTLEGLNRHPGLHAAGVVIGDRPLWEYCPLSAVRSEGGRSGAATGGREGKQATTTRVTQYAKDEVEEVGLVKFDFLGLKTLTVIDHAVRLINEGRERRGEEPLHSDAIPSDDPAAFELITEGNTTGVFQLESSGFKELLRRVKPERLEDVIAAVALYRPGPLQSGMADSFAKRKHGDEEVTYPHPWLEETLRETHGVMVYQEQVMEAASVLAGYSLGQADILRRAMGKKKHKEMARQREVFRDGCVERGIPAEQADDIFETIEKFAGYGFNKSHSAAYGLISYQTAWLKARYPVEFMAALLTSERDNTDKVVRLIGEARAMGITVLPPSVNHSEHDFTVSEGAVRFGLGAIKGVGTGAVEAVLEARAEGGPFESLFDFCTRVDLKRVNRRVIEALVKCGAFDDFQLPRLGLFQALDKAIDRGQAMQRDRERGQFNLFGELEPAAPAAGEGEEVQLVDATREWPDKERLAYERECLGFYVSGHPLDRYDDEIRRLGVTPLAELGSAEERTTLRVAVMVVQMREVRTRNGDGKMAFLALEDRTGRAEGVVFQRVHTAFADILARDEPLMIEGSVKHEGEGDTGGARGGGAPSDGRTTRLFVESARTLSDVRRNTTTRIRLRLATREAEGQRLDRLRDVLAEFGESDGGLPVELALDVPEEEGEAIVALDDARYRLPVEDEAVERIERVVGRDAVAFL